MLAAALDQQGNIAHAPATKAKIFAHVHTRQIRQPLLKPRQKIIRRDPGQRRRERLGNHRIDSERE